MSKPESTGANDAPIGLALDRRAVRRPAVYLGGWFMGRWIGNFSLLLFC
jgi:hypothetical protein